MNLLYYKYFEAFPLIYLYILEIYLYIIVCVCVCARIYSWSQKFTYTLQNLQILIILPK